MSTSSHFYASSPFSAFIELLWISLWLKGMLWLVLSSVQTTQTLHIPSKGVVISYNLCVYCSSTFNFLQELSLCIHNLTNWCRRPSFRLVSQLSAYLPHLAVSFLDFGESQRCRTLPFTWTLRGYCRITSWPNLNIVVS